MQSQMREKLLLLVLRPNKAMTQIPFVLKFVQLIVKKLFPCEIQPVNLIYRETHSLHLIYAFQVILQLLFGYLYHLIDLCNELFCLQNLSPKILHITVPTLRKRKSIALERITDPFYSLSYVLAFFKNQDISCFAYLVSFRSQDQTIKRFNVAEHFTSCGSEYKPLKFHNFRRLNCACQISD